MFVLFWFHLVSRMFDLAYFRAFFAGVPWPHAARGHRQTFISRHAGPRIRCSCTQMLVPSSFDQSALGCRSSIAMTYVISYCIEEEFKGCLGYSKVRVPQFVTI